MLKPSTILNFHRNLVKLKYRLLLCPKRRAKPGPQGPTQDLIHAVVEMRKAPDFNSLQQALIQNRQQMQSEIT